MDKILTLLFYGIYFYLNYISTIRIDYTSFYEQMIAYILMPIIVYMLDRIAYKITFQLTGIVTTNYGGKLFKSMIHWIIRLAMWGIIIILGLTGLYTAILSPVVHWLAVNYQNLLDELAKALVYNQSSK